MPCDQRLAELREEQRKREEAARRKALAKIEEALAAGTAKLVSMPGGKFRLVGATLPNGMKDLCVLAALQKRNSKAFRQARAKAQAQGQNFMRQHALAHQKAGHGH